MNKPARILAALGMCTLLTFSTVHADDNLEAYKGVKDVKIGGQWFLAYRAGKLNGGPDINEFDIKRGYINIYKKLSTNLVARITPDVSIDHEGDGRGDVELRLKYAHLITKMNDWAIFTSPYFEFGLVHRPWLDFEQHINTYRVQGTMFLERVKIFNSADFGVTFVSLLGGEMDKEYQKNVSKAFPGRHGSVAVGVYNGGGYHAIEANKNKSIETRLSLRPLYAALPGLQVHYTGAYGKGNTEYSPEWTLNGLMASYEAHRFIVTGQLYSGIGNSSGTYVDDNRSKPHNGYSFFGEYKIPARRLSIFARYDNWTGNEGEDKTDRTIAGVAYHFAGRSKFLIDYDLYRDKVNGETKSGVFEIAIEVRF